MTLFGKILAVLELILGVGIAVASASLYANRPGWFDPAPDAGVDKGNHPVSFPALSAEIDSLSKAAANASKNWGDDYKLLTSREEARKERQEDTRTLLNLAKNARGDDQPAFFDLKEDEATRLLDLKGRDNPVTMLSPLGGEKKVAIGGADTLLAQFERDSKAAQDTAAESVKLREVQKQLGVEVINMEQRYLKQLTIRDQLTEEAGYLAALEINAVEQRDTVNNRRKQLIDRLGPFRGQPGKQ
jgi:hypothetical protein